MKKKLSRYYLRPCGSIIYDEFGIIFPQRNNINLFSIIKDCGGKHIRWTKGILWTSQLEVITFHADFGTVAGLSVKLIDYPLEIVNVWNEFIELVKVGKIDRLIQFERNAKKGSRDIEKKLANLADIVDGVSNYDYSG